MAVFRKSWSHLFPHTGSSPSSLNLFSVVYTLSFCFCTTDKHETKLKGMIYFQAIEDVFYDHLKSYKVNAGLAGIVYGFVDRNLWKCHKLLQLGITNLIRIVCSATLVLFTFFSAVNDC